MSYATQSPSTVPRSDANYGALIASASATPAPAPTPTPSPTPTPMPDPVPTPVPPSSTAPAWYANTLLNGWSRLPFPSIGSQVQSTVADRANPDDVGGSWKPIYPTFGDSAGYVQNQANPGAWPAAGLPQIAGITPLPGSTDYRGDQGATPVYGGTVVRRGKTYTGTFMVWAAQGGHGVGINNQILAYHLESGLFLDLTQPDIPPYGCNDTNPASAWHPVSGRPLSTHGYNNGVFDAKRNTILQVAGPAQVVGPTGNITYAMRLDGDAQAGNANDAVAFPARHADYFSTAGGAYPNGRNATSCVDNDLDEIWNSYPGAPFNGGWPLRASLAPGSQWRSVELVQPADGAAPLGAAAVVSWALEKEPWLAFFNELNPYRATILNRRWSPGDSGAWKQNPAQWEQKKRKFWNVRFAPLNGDPANAIPTPAQCDPSLIANVDGGIPSTVVFDPWDRCWYAIVFILQPGQPLDDVYRITPPAFDQSDATGAGSTFVQGIGSANEIVAPWVTEKIPLAAGSVIELPVGGTNFIDGSKCYPSHKTFMVTPRPMHGILAMHDPSKSPQFLRLP